MKIQPLLLSTAALVLPLGLTAATLTVDDVFDGTGANDIAPGDGVCFDGIGVCTLRAAIEEANALGGRDTIEFAVDGTVRVSSDVGALPQIIGQLDIDATTAPGYPGSSIDLQDAPPSVFISGENLGGAAGSSSGLRFSAGSASFSSVRGLGVIRFATGVRVSPAASNVFIDGCYVGVLADGAAAGNGTGIFLGTDNNIVGRAVGGFGNVISSNTGSGINLGVVSGNLIGGNRIGTTPNGVSPRGNGIGISGASASDNRIGIFSDTLDFGNLISGNLGAGIQLVGDDNIIGANRVGLSANGNMLGNGAGGIVITGDNNQIGSTATNAGNVVSNNVDGIVVDGMSNEVAGNLVGIASLGAGVSGNSGNGILVAGGSQNQVLTNRVYNSGGDGIEINGSGTSVQGNELGFAIFTASELNYGNGAAGINVRAAGNLVGTVVANTIGFSGNDGIRLAGADNQVSNNFVGVASDGTAIGNDGQGIQLGSVILTTENNMINNNQIAFSELSGVALLGTADSGNAIYQNEMFNNGQIGIDLAVDNVTPNDLDDADVGPNNLQNFPLIVSVVLNSDSSPQELIIEWQIDSLDGNASYPILADFYLADSQSSGEGRTWLGFDLASTPGFSNMATLPMPLAISGGFVVATATDLNGNGSTSEFSVPVVFGDPQALFSDGFEAL